MFIDSGLRRACAVLGIKLTHSATRADRPAGAKSNDTSAPSGTSSWSRSPPRADGVGTRVDTLAELNSLFTAWVEQVYHQRVHSETGQAPLARFLAAGPPVPTPAELLAEAFRWGEWRTVTKTATVSLHGNLYEVDPAFAGVEGRTGLRPVRPHRHHRAAPRPARREGDAVQDRPARAPQGRRRHPTTGRPHRDRLPAPARGPPDPLPGRTAPLRPTHRTNPARTRTGRSPQRPDEPTDADCPSTRPPTHDGLRYDADLLTLAAPAHLRGGRRSDVEVTG